MTQKLKNIILKYSKINGRNKIIIIPAFYTEPMDEYQSAIQAIEDFFFKATYVEPRTKKFLRKLGEVMDKENDWGTAELMDVFEAYEKEKEKRLTFRELKSIVSNINELSIKVKFSKDDIKKFTNEYFNEDRK